jgi:hypothetical protein
MRASHLVLASLVAAAALSCKDSTAPHPARLTLVSGPSATVGSNPSTPFVLELRDSSGALLPNRFVTVNSLTRASHAEPDFMSAFTFTGDYGYLQPTETSASGRVTLYMHFGNIAGTAKLGMLNNETGRIDTLNIEVSP